MDDEKIIFEDRIIFKAYLRGLARHLKDMKAALDTGNYNQAEKLLDELIEDTQKGIED